MSRKILTKHKQNLGINLESVYSYNKLIDINMASIKWAMEQLNINVPLVYSSNLSISTKLNIDPVLKKLGFEDMGKNWRFN